MDKIQILKTDRRGLKIVVNDYMYTKQKKLPITKLDGSVWKKNCKGSVTTDQMILNVLKNIEHKNHPPFP